MLPRADLTGTRPLAPVDAPSPVSSVADARQETFNRLSQIAIGKQFQAEILSRLNDGTYMVRIADSVARMNLPAGMKAGDTMPMTVIGTDPRPTFLLNQQPNGPTVTLSNAGQLADRFLQTVAQEGIGTSGVATSGVATSAVGKPGLSAAGMETSALPFATAAPTSLSDTGRLISVILQHAQQEGAATAIVGKTPLIATPHADALQMASALQDSLTYSGVFYESHVAQWTHGERSTGELQREPQATLLQAAGRDAEAVENARAVFPQPAGVQANAAVSGDGDGTAGIPATLNAEASRLINLQLDVLENRRVAWQGELWPGQPMEWEVSEDRAEHAVPETQQSWKSTVRFELPSLGAVAATIHMAGGLIQMQVRAASETTAEVLRMHGRDLANAMEAAGSTLDSLTVKQDGQI